MENKKSVLLYSILVVYLLIKFFLFETSNYVVFQNLVNPIFWLLFATLTYIVLKDYEVRTKYKYDKVQNIIIILISFIIVYFGLGLVVGYQYSPYSHTLMNIFKNLIMFIPIILFQEYVRYKLLVTDKKSKFLYIIVSLFYTAIILNVHSFIDNTASNVSLFQYVCESLLPSLTTSFLCTYLALNVKWDVSFYYRALMVALPILVPILPAFNWLMAAIIEIVLPFIIYLSINNLDIIKSRLSRRVRDKSGALSNIVFVVFVSVFVMFIVGVFKYMPVAIMSNSMVPKFRRGDAVVVLKCDNKCLNELKVYDIIYFRVDSDFIVHRIVDINTVNGEIVYTTKGDNNNSVDHWDLKKSDIKGKVMFSIPFVGYPSVMLSEFLFKG